jgi:hypothetical protein
MPKTDFEEFLEKKGLTYRCPVCQSIRFSSEAMGLHYSELGRKEKPSGNIVLSVFAVTCLDCQHVDFFEGPEII